MDHLSVLTSLMMIASVITLSSSIFIWFIVSEIKNHFEKSNLTLEEK